MKIAFDGQLLLKGEKTGIGWCAENILMEFAKYGDCEKYINYFSVGYSTKNEMNVSKYNRRGFQLQKCSWFHDVIYRILWNLFPLPYSLFFKEKVDATIFFNYSVPPGVKGKKVVFVHDMSYKACPDTVRLKTRRFLEFSLRTSCARADLIITVSEFSKREIIKYLGVPEDKIEVIRLGVNSDRYHANYTKNQQAIVCKKYGLPKNYLLYLGTLEPRKNIERLIRAYAKLLEKGEDVPCLVLAGRKGWLYEPIFAVVEELNLHSKVHFIGYVSPEDAPILLSGAEVFLFPSVYEGFGLPIIEAMACGVPVVTSQLASLPEVAGDAAVFVDPYDIRSIQIGISRVLNNSKLCEYYSAMGKKRAKEFTWEQASLRLKDLCERLHDI